MIVKIEIHVLPVRRPQPFRDSTATNKRRCWRQRRWSSPTLKRNSVEGVLGSTGEGFASFAVPEIKINLLLVLHRCFIDVANWVLLTIYVIGIAIEASIKVKLLNVQKKASHSPNHLFDIHTDGGAGRRRLNGSCGRDRSHSGHLQTSDQVRVSRAVARRVCSDRDARHRVSWRRRSRGWHRNFGCGLLKKENKENGDWNIWR